MLSSRDLRAQIEPFDSFWEAPSEVDKGFDSFGRFYRANYLKRLPSDTKARILVISCGPGYFLDLLKSEGYENVLGIDSDSEKLHYAEIRSLNCRRARGFEELYATEVPYDVIICEQELNHLTKREMLAFLELAYSKVAPGGMLLCHGLNGANPIVGAETLAQNFDHFNTFTAYSLRQVLEQAGFVKVQVFGLHLYVFYLNPANYIAWGISSFLHLLFRFLFLIYGKSNRIFTKKIGAVGFKVPTEASRG